MTSLITQRVHRLADTLADLKMKIRVALSTELATDIGTTIRDVLLAALVERTVSPSCQPYFSAQSRHRHDDYIRERHEWSEPRNPWADDDDDRNHSPTRFDLDQREEDQSIAVPTAVAVAIGVNVGRWWLVKKTSTIAVLSIGLLATTLGFVGGPIARVALSVLATAADILTAESILARADPI